MRQKNNGQGSDNIIQNQFTAYLITAMRRKKKLYRYHNDRQHFFETPDDGPDRLQEFLHIQDLTETLPLSMQLENTALEEALKQLNNRDRYIFLARILSGKSFEDLADELGMGYKGIAAAYYRIIRKIKAKLKETDYEL